MKKVILGAILSAGLVMTGSVQANNINKSLEKDLVNVCNAIKTNNKSKLHRAVRRSGVSYKNIANGLVCNGHDAVTFALMNNSNDTAKLMARKGNIDSESLVAKL
jgi:hypothetical protein